MRILKKLSTYLSLSILVFSLGVINVDTQRGTSFKQAHAGTILGSNQEHLVRFLYFLINGPGPNGYPDGMGGPDDGFLGMIRQITGPNALGGGLSASGYSTCDSVPATGSATMTDEEGTFTMYFETPVKSVPSGYTGAGSTFNKRVTVQFNGTTFMNIEFNCATTVGWMRMAMGENGMVTAPLRNIEVYWDTETSSAATLELYMYYEAGEATANGNEYFMTRFETETGNKYKFWISRAANFTGTTSDNGFRAVAYGDSTTDIVNSFLLYASNVNAIGHTGVDVTGINDIFAPDTSTGGDQQCLVMTDVTNVTEGVSGECSGLTLSTAPAPIIDGTGDYSVSWIADTTKMKAKMTAIAQPTNP